MSNPSLAAPQNVIAIRPKSRKPYSVPQQRFKIVGYENPRTGSRSWRVTGTKRDGLRIRENFADEKGAQCRLVALEAEWLARETDSTLRSTRLTAEQVSIAEACFSLLDEDTHLLTALNYWKAHGAQQMRVDAPKLDDAFEQFKKWVQTNREMRPLTKLAALTRVNAFVNSTRNIKVSEFTPEIVEKFLDGMATSQRTRINYKDGIGRFFAWCMDRPRRWIAVNPCAVIKIRIGDHPPPKILTLGECENLMREAEQFKNGRLLPYLALTMFAGLRPFEARRIKWEQINFQDSEIRIEGNQSKTHRSRSFVLDETTIEWLRVHKNQPFGPANLQNDFRKLTEKIGFGTKTDDKPHLRPWPKDVLRHTAISHFFRKTHSYGQTAERFGNSEAVIKRHYQGRVTSEETKTFYAIRPTKSENK